MKWEYDKITDRKWIKLLVGVTDVVNGHLVTARLNRDQRTVPCCLFPAFLGSIKNFFKKKGFYWGVVVLRYNRVILKGKFKKVTLLKNIFGSLLEG